MYRSILVPLDRSAGDAAILAHVADLARLCEAKVLLLHCAGGWRGRYFEGRLPSPDAPRMQEYLDEKARELRDRGVEASTLLRYGEAGPTILAVAEEEDCDLIAMSTHGHRGIMDVLLGSAASQVRHAARVPVLLLRG
jgi:nucleotide-binding universal stress UspA family protein